jgi:hypothetical protein
MAERSDGAPERVGRALGRALLRGRGMARQLGDPTTQERLVAAGRSAAARHGPDAVEQAAQRAVDRALIGVAARSGISGERCTRCGQRRAARWQGWRAASPRACGALRSADAGQLPADAYPAQPCGPVWKTSMWLTATVAGFEGLEPAS